MSHSCAQYFAARGLLHSASELPFAAEFATCHGKARNCRQFLLYSWSIADFSSSSSEILPSDKITWKFNTWFVLCTAEMSRQSLP